MAPWGKLSDQLSASLGLDAPPVGISFTQDVPEGVAHFDEPLRAPAADGRAGRVPAGCVFWMKAAERSFTTVAEDHANCSVGSLTHGFVSLDEVAGHDDVKALLDSGWVDAPAVAGLPTVAERPGAVTYGPLSEIPVDPDVVLMRVNPYQLMVLTDAVPDTYIGGKPQCHVIAMAKEQGRVAASIGCALSRVRTGMGDHEMACAIPGPRLGEVVAALTRAKAVDGSVEAYAADDAARFSTDG